MVEAMFSILVEATLACLDGNLRKELLHVGEGQFHASCQELCSSGRCQSSGRNSTFPRQSADHLGHGFVFVLFLVSLLVSLHTFLSLRKSSLKEFHCTVLPLLDLN